AGRGRVRRAGRRAGDRTGLESARLLVCEGARRDPSQPREPRGGHRQGRARTPPQAV
ncbi:MAG: hypothetical protein AVDCRST_MAG01-01-4149, partial [uncultured Rubrobacteraceae bacterium]